MKKASIVSGCIALMSVGLASSSAFALSWQTTYFPGSQCRSQVSSAGTSVDTHTLGIENDSSSVGIYVYCPVPLVIQSSWYVGDGNPNSALVYYNEPNAGSGSAAALWCWAEDSGDGGAIVSTPMKYDCATAGGCTGVNDGSFSGYLALDFSSGSFTTSTNFYDGSTHGTNIICKLPTEASGNTSSIEEYQFSNNYPSL